MNSLKIFWRHLRGSFWFVPLLIVVFSAVLATALIEADSASSTSWMAGWPRMFGAGAAGARGMLSTIAGSMMTVVGITFSMTLVTLALASSQYTSRILRNFMRDRVTQIVLGIFAGIFTYCLILLRTIRGGDDAAFIPSIAVTVSVVMSIGGIGALIFFIHHIASSIQASNIIAAVAAETMTAIDRLFPEHPEDESEEDEEDQSALPLTERKWQDVPSLRSGYIQGVDTEALLNLAREHGTIVQMRHGVGDFVVHQSAIASVAMESPPEAKVTAAVQSAYSIDRHRTVAQDAAFGVRQIVDMALRALSTGLNDSTTAIMCIDYLTAIMARLASRPIPSARRFEDHELRMIAIGPSFATLLGESFDQIRSSAAGNTAILLRMLGGLQTIAGFTTGSKRRLVLREHVECIAELGARTVMSPGERAQIENRLKLLHEAFDQNPVLPKPDARTTL